MRDLIGLGLAGYVAGSFALHRSRLAYELREGLELELLERIHVDALPPEAAPVVEAIAQASRAAKQGGPRARRRLLGRALAGIRELRGGTCASTCMYLEVQVKLMRAAGPLRGELAALGCLVELRRALARLGPSPLLHLARAHALARLGQTGAALDALGRAVYYANGDPFFTELVLASECVERRRPRLRQLCTGLATASGAF